MGVLLWSSVRRELAFCSSGSTGVVCAVWGRLGCWWNQLELCCRRHRRRRRRGCCRCWWRPRYPEKQIDDRPTDRWTNHTAHAPLLHILSLEHRTRPSRSMNTMHSGHFLHYKERSREKEGRQGCTVFWTLALVFKSEFPSDRTKRRIEKSAGGEEGRDGPFYGSAHRIEFALNLPSSTGVGRRNGLSRTLVGWHDSNFHQCKFFE